MLKTMMMMCKHDDGNCDETDYVNNNEDDDDNDDDDDDNYDDDNDDDNDNKIYHVRWRRGWAWFFRWVQESLPASSLSASCPDTAKFYENCMKVLWKSHESFIKIARKFYENLMIII